MIKTCLKCNAEKPNSDFYQFFDKWADKHYYSSRCKPCHLQQKKENPNLSKNTKNEKLKLRYGLTYEAWEQMRANENFSCMICGITETELGKVLDVDHCHSSGKARGILCNACNTILGRAKDNPEILKAAVKYIETQAGGYQ